MVFTTACHGVPTGTTSCTGWNKCKKFTTNKKNRLRPTSGANGESLFDF